MSLLSVPGLYCVKISVQTAMSAILLYIYKFIEIGSISYQEGKVVKLLRKPASLSITQQRL